MADIRINALATTATSSASDDFIAIDGAANGTRKLSVYSPTLGGNLTVNGGTVQLNNLKVENTDGDAYASGPSTAGKYLTLRSGNTTGGINFRDSNYNQVGIYNQTTDTWSFAKSTTIGGNLTVSGTGSFTGQINASSGYQFRGANNTPYEVMRYVGGTNNPGLFVTVTESTKKVLLTASGSVVGGQTIGIGAEGSEALTIGSANATLAGNLTVSGTGNSSVAGKWLVGSTTAPSGGSATILAAASVGGGVQFANTVANNGGLINAVNGAGLTFYSYTGALGAESYTELARFVSGNLLLGTTTDSANGKLQLATHTTSAGGIGFGTDTSLYRAGAGTLSLMDYTSAATGVGGVLNLQGFTSGTSGLNNFAIIKGVKASGTVGGNFIVLTSDTAGNQQTALTLDSSQSAKFAGTIRVNGSAFTTRIRQDLAVIDFTNTAENGYVAGTFQATSFAFNTAGTLALTLDSSQRTILSGPLRLANAYAAGAPAATGYVTIQDSSGTTYKVLVST